MPIQHLDIAVIGDEELVNALRLAGISKHYTIKGNHDVRENVRKTLTELLAEPNVGIVIILEDYAQYVEDLLTQIRKRKGTTPVIVEAPSKFGTKYPNVREYYRALIRESIGFEIEI
ncbi:MAG: V-type ATP synthase subunit F [Chloroflexi bacterium]|nr:V-type ATP synthase subunit F [Chloroflexota bacterium]